MLVHCVSIYLNRVHIIEKCTQSWTDLAKIIRSIARPFRGRWKRAGTEMEWESVIHFIMDINHAFIGIITLSYDRNNPILYHRSKLFFEWIMFYYMYRFCRLLQRSLEEICEETETTDKVLSLCFCNSSDRVESYFWMI